jgi:hypothetical protein
MSRILFGKLEEFFPIFAATISVLLGFALYLCRSTAKAFCAVGFNKDKEVKAGFWKNAG